MEILKVTSKCRLRKGEDDISIKAMWNGMETDTYGRAVGSSRAGFSIFARETLGREGKGVEEGGGAGAGRKYVSAKKEKETLSAKRDTFNWIVF